MEAKLFISETVNKLENDLFIALKDNFNEIYNIVAEKEANKAK